MSCPSARRRQQTREPKAHAHVTECARRIQIAAPRGVSRGIAVPVFPQGIAPLLLRLRVRPLRRARSDAFALSRSDGSVDMIRSISGSVAARDWQPGKPSRLTGDERFPTLRWRIHRHSRQRGCALLLHNRPVRERHLLALHVTRRLSIAVGDMRAPAIHRPSSASSGADMHTTDAGTHMIRPPICWSSSGARFHCGGMEA